jgi:hypothetical protein
MIDENSFGDDVEEEEIILPDFFPKKGPRYYKVEPWQILLSIFTIIFVVILLFLNTRGLMEGTS